MMLLIVPLTHAQTRTPGTDIMAEVSYDNMRVILRGMGIEFTERVSGDSDVFSFQLNGHKVSLTNSVKDMRLYASLTDKVDLAKVNEWNSANRFGRAYVNDTSGPALENDLSFSGGVTSSAIESFIRQFRTTLVTYVQFVTNTQARAISASSAPPASSSEVRSFTKSSSAKQRVQTSVNDFTVWIDPAKWKRDQNEPPGQMLFTNVNGKAWARIISEGIPVPTDTLREVATTIARNVDPNTRIVLEEKRIVNGREILALQMNATTKNIPFTYLGYYHGGTSGVIQVVTYTVASEFDNNLPVFTEFLNGLEVSDKDMPPAGSQGTLVLSPEMSIKYDQKKWKQTQSGEAGRFSFAHSSGGGYGLIIFERLPLPTDSLPDIALSNARRADPDASIVFREKRKVNGVDLWFLEIDAAVKNIPFRYYGYYYGGRNGAIQVLTYTAKTMVSEHEKDFMDFLNGFVVSE